MVGKQKAQMKNSQDQENGKVENKILREQIQKSSFVFVVKILHIRKSSYVFVVSFFRETDGFRVEAMFLHE